MQPIRAKGRKMPGLACRKLVVRNHAQVPITGAPSIVTTGNLNNMLDHHSLEATTYLPRKKSITQLNPVQSNNNSYQNNRTTRQYHEHSLQN